MKRFLPLLLPLIMVAVTAFWLVGPRTKLGRDNWFLAPNPVAWPFGAWLLPLGVLLIFGGFAFVSSYDFLYRAKTEKIRHTSVRLARLGVFILALAWPFSLLGPTPVGTNGAANLIQATWSDVSNGYFSASYEVGDVRDYTRTYADTRQKTISPQQAHVATHPPGAVLFYRGARALYEAVPPLQSFCSALARFLTNEDEAKLASDSRAIVYAATQKTPTVPDSAVGAALWCAFVTALLLASGTYAVFDLARGPKTPLSETTPFTRDPRRNLADIGGLTAAALFALAPMPGLFAFSLDAVIAAGAAWTLWLLARGTTRGYLGAGALLAVVTFLSYGALAIGLLGALGLVLHLRRAALKPVALCAAGFVAGWLLILVLFPHDAPRVFHQAMAAHHAATLTSRAHWPWSGLNLVFFALFIGWPIVAALVVSARAKALFAWGVGALVTALLLSISGNVRGEVERLWLFLLPPFAAWAGFALSQPKAEPETGEPRPLRYPYLTHCGFIALQAAQTLIMAATLAPLVRP